MERLKSVSLEILFILIQVVALSALKKNSDSKNLHKIEALWQDCSLYSSSRFIEFYFIHLKSLQDGLG